MGKSHNDIPDLRQHQLESRMAFLRAGYGRVLVLSDGFLPVRIRSFVGKLALLFDARLVLRVEGVAVVREQARWDAQGR